MIALKNFLKICKTGTKTTGSKGKGGVLESKRGVTHVYTQLATGVLMRRAGLEKEGFIMTKFTLKQLKSMIADGVAQDITSGTIATRHNIEAREGYLSKIGYSCGIEGNTGVLLQGRNTGTLYIVAGRTAALCIFNCAYFTK
jgi:hypothetical protein